MLNTDGKMLLLVLQIIDDEDGKDAVTRVDALDYRDDMTSALPAGIIECSYVRLMPHTGRYKMISLRPSYIEFKSDFVTFFAQYQESPTPRSYGTYWPPYSW